MRFASLALERYGHFEGCELTFRPGAPDLHVVYGANEAGKTTSMAAVSDLLFGFPSRSPYNFRYDYSLLRVGAVLEEDGKTLACRRKKGTTNTLLGPDDRALDDGTLRAMLRGQTRETFGLSFSLDQDGLRAGGRAMVEARNDLGRALFAAGSGLTGVSDELSRIEEDADAIWGPRASSKRSFTIAQRELETQTRAVRDQSLRPKTWLDARAAVVAAQASLDDAQRRRDETLAEVSRVERTRRIAPSARLLADQLASLLNHAETVDISPQREDTAETTMAEIDRATLAKAIAVKLADEATERMQALVPDPTVLARADRIDELGATAGAVAKARQDMVRLAAEHATGNGLVARLREEVGAAEPPTRIVSSRLRELALAHLQDVSALDQIAESEEDLAQRRKTMSESADEAPKTGELAAVVAAVDAARALGVDADARCDTAERKAGLAATAVEHAIARLAPWSGDIPRLLALPRIAATEIEAARTTLEDLAATQTRETALATRAREEAAALELQMRQLSSGPAISADEIAASRTQRDIRWQPIRDHVLRQTTLHAPDDAVAAFEATVIGADERSDLRFAAADESSRLADMGQRTAKLLLDAEQAEARATTTTGRGTAFRADWMARLTRAGYAEMEPEQVTSWLVDRDAAEAAHAIATSLEDEAATICSRRAGVRAALLARLPVDAAENDATELAPVLARAERIRFVGEAAEQTARLGKAAAEQLKQEANALSRRRKRLEEVATVRVAAWRDLLADAQLEMDVAGAIATLDVLEELRVASAVQTELKARMDGMARDADDHDTRVASIADALGIDASGSPAERLQTMRERLAAARATANVVASIEETLAQRTADAAAEEAKLAVALESLGPLLEETVSIDTAELGAAIQKSRDARTLRTAIAVTETAIKSAGDGKSLEELLAAQEGVDPDGLAGRTQTLSAELATLNGEVAAAAAAHGDARTAFAGLETTGAPAVDAATDAGQARSELGVLTEQYILKRAQAVTLRWAIEQYRERHQDPMLLRASELFSSLTIGRYSALRIDNDGTPPGYSACATTAAPWWMSAR
ncbi:AAA family ATPase [Sphingomonas aurantiaca]|uniref:ATP-binding protein n=1 Tax=Sphingomonas aurantiaca TaxID=185949 RepID=UPI002FE129E5